MLVLSRRTNEKIIFPNINTSVQVISFKSGTVRLGIDAPHDVAVYREEVLASLPNGEVAAAPTGPAGGEQVDLAATVHRLYNHLNCGTIGLALLRRQVELGLSGEMLATIAKIENELGSLKQTCDSVARRPAAPAGELPRALLVEDDVNECELLAGYLRLAGMTVDTANDGSDALAYVREGGRPDVVLLDMFMPRCDGPSTVRAIRGNPDYAGIKIFGVTGADTTKFDLPQGAGGVDRWFRKPLNPEVLLQELRQSMSA